jgi:hypothetical protein
MATTGDVVVQAGRNFLNPCIDDTTCRRPGAGCSHGSIFQKGDAMFWGFLVLVGFAAVFAQLGAMSVWMAILRVGLQLALVVIAGLAIVLLWQRVVRGKNNSKQIQGRTND